MAAVKSPVKPKYRYLRWVWLMFVLVDVLSAPRAFKAMIAMCSEDRRMMVVVPFVLTIAVCLNWWWLKLWWRYRPSHGANDLEDGE